MSPAKPMRRIGDGGLWADAHGVLWTDGQRGWVRPQSARWVSQERTLAIATRYRMGRVLVGTRVYVRSPAGGYWPERV